MTAPVQTDTVVQGLVKYLIDIDEIQAVLGVFPLTNTPYLFQTRLWQQMEGTQSTAAVISRSGGWAAPNQHNSMSFPRLSLEIYADPIRDGGQNVTDYGEADRRLESAYLAFDQYLHRPAPEIVYWGSIRTLGCLRQAEPAVTDISDGDGLTKLQVFYGVIVG